jgi:hypothetical protein
MGTGGGHESRGVVEARMCGVGERAERESGLCTKVCVSRHDHGRILRIVGRNGGSGSRAEGAELSSAGQHGSKAGRGTATTPQGKGPNQGLDRSPAARQDLPQQHGSKAEGPPLGPAKAETLQGPTRHLRTESTPPEGRISGCYVLAKRGLDPCAYRSRNGKETGVTTNKLRLT